MFQKVLGVYTLYSQGLSDLGHSTDSALGPIYIQSMFESESKTLEYTKKGKEHFLLLAYTNGSLVWAITPELPKKGSALQVSFSLSANASNLEIPLTRGWYTGNIFEGWKHEISIEVFPKGGKKHIEIKHKMKINSSFSGLCVGRVEVRRVLKRRRARVDEGGAKPRIPFWGEVPGA